jgi:peptidoglycan-associated lipoprotein
MKHLLLVFIFVIVIGAAGSCRKRIANVPSFPPAPVQLVAPTSPPVASITANHTSVERGQSITLEWQTENASGIEISGMGRVDPNGNAEVNLQESASYTLTATGTGGIATDVVRITVTSRNIVEIPPESAARVARLDEDVLAQIEDVLFDCDRATVRLDQLPKVDTLATWLREHPETRIVIDGHRDERGNSEYNLGLGDRRATVIRERLQAIGIAVNRLEIISYGEERPVCSERSETCWSRNRRAQFTLASTS